MNYEIKNDKLTVVISDAGAELQSIKSVDGTEYLWQGDPAVWADRAPNIFPYVARLTNETYTMNGNAYHMKIHGLVLYHQLQVEVHTENCIIFRLDSTEETKKSYPFDFIYRITYTLYGDKLMTSFSVENRGNERMHFAVGGHPGFQVPLEAGLSFEDYYLEFGQDAQPYRIGFTKECFINGQDTLYPLEEGRKIALRHDLFDQDAIVLKHMSRTVALKSDKGSRKIIVSYPDFPYLGIWHMPQMEAPYVCIEPWSSLPSRAGVVEEFSQQSDLIGLAPGKTYETMWSMEFC